jgi:hypothetical protein
VYGKLVSMLSSIRLAVLLLISLYMCFHYLCIDLLLLNVLLKCTSFSSFHMFCIDSRFGEFSANGFELPAGMIYLPSVSLNGGKTDFINYENPTITGQSCIIMIYQ